MTGTLFVLLYSGKCSRVAILRMWDLEGFCGLIMQWPGCSFRYQYRRFTTPCNSKSEKRKTIIIELVAVWSLYDICTSVTKSKASRFTLYAFQRARSHKIPVCGIHVGRGC